MRGCIFEGIHRSRGWSRPPGRASGSSVHARARQAALGCARESADPYGTVRHCRFCWNAQLAHQTGFPKRECLCCESHKKAKRFAPPRVQKAQSIQLKRHLYYVAHCLRFAESIPPAFIGRTGRHAGESVT